MQLNDTKPATTSFLEDVNDCAAARKLYPVTETCAYLDSAHYSQYSLETRRRLLDFIDTFTFTNRNLSLFNLKTAETLKEKCAALIGAKSYEIIITGSTTHGLNIFANGIDLKAGDCVAYADSEFPAVVYPWLNMEKLKGFRNVMIPSFNGQIKLEDIDRIVRENNVKVLTISSVGFLGFRNDLKAVNRICKDNDCWFVVDGIQSTGVCPIDVKELEIDFFSAGSQKWMMAPAGIGFAYISNRVREHVSPTYVATTSVDFKFENFLDYKLNFRSDGGAYENSTPNTLGMIGLESSIELFLKLGPENIFRHILELQDIFIEEMKGSDFVIECSLKPSERSNILIFSHKDSSLNHQIQKELEKHCIFIAVRENFLRLSAHLFNNKDDIYKLTEALLTMDIK